MKPLPKHWIQVTPISFFRCDGLQVLRLPRYPDEADQIWWWLYNPRTNFEVQCADAWAGIEKGEHLYPMVSCACAPLEVLKQEIEESLKP